MNLDRPIKVTQSRSFKNSALRLHPRKKLNLDHAVRAIADNPNLGFKKKGELSYLMLYKFNMATKQQGLLGYEREEGKITIHLLKIENN